MNGKIAEKLSKELRFSHFSSKYWLELFCKHEFKNGEDLVYIQTLDDPKIWVLQYTPRNLKNLVNAEIMWATEDELHFIESYKIEIIKKEKVMTEYFYKNSDFRDYAGSENKRNRKAVKIFEKKYAYKITHICAKNMIINFLKKWNDQQKVKTAPYERNLKFCYYLIDYLDQDENLKSTFIFINDCLVGFFVSEYLYENYGIGLHQKIDYNIRGLGRWIHKEQAIYFKEAEYVAFGGAVGDSGIENFKESLNPYKKELYYHLKLGKIKN